MVKFGQGVDVDCKCTGVDTEHHLRHILGKYDPRVMLAFIKFIYPSLVKTVQATPERLDSSKSFFESLVS